MCDVCVCVCVCVCWRVRTFLKSRTYLESAEDVNESHNIFWTAYISG